MTKRLLKIWISIAVLVYCSGAFARDYSSYTELNQQTALFIYAAFAPETEIPVASIIQYQYHENPATSTRAAEIQKFIQSVHQSNAFTLVKRITKPQYDPVRKAFAIPAEALSPFNHYQFEEPLGDIQIQTPTLSAFLYLTGEAADIDQDFVFLKIFGTVNQAGKDVNKSSGDTAIDLMGANSTTVRVLKLRLEAASLYYRDGKRIVHTEFP